MTKTIFAVAVALCFTAQIASADQWNKKTKVTFGQAVSVPGAVLQPGTYVFALDDSNSNRHIVRVQNERQNRTYATILAIPDYRLNASSRTVMYFGERGRTDIGGNPVAIKSWFYPGDNFGQRFVYPRKEATAIAAVYNQPVPAAPVETATVPTERPAEVKVVMATPDKKEEEYKPAAFDKHDAQDTAGQDGEAVTVAQAAPAAQPPAAPAAPERPRTLPTTNSSTPLIGGLGLLLLAGSGLARFIASRNR
jgi:hypothetical protein